MTIDELKQSWGKLDTSTILPDSSTESIEKRVALHHIASTRDKLSRQFYTLGTIAVLCPLIFFPLWQFSHFFVILASIFVISVGCMQFILAAKTDRIDLTKSSISQALASTLRLETLRNRFRMAGMIMGIPLILYLIYVVYLQNDTYMLVGCITGAVIGSVIGVVKNARLAAQIRHMKEELNDIN